ncbi:hypothetical protein AGABI1DRAFT_111871 [Agaricus bisporus var. burnettii JB137-S8]|uniref:Yeast cell wall synthesis Kre9/Knh1-like N-terminal domain-containing protein n=2 Tax=Agaricus bisporus var. burnettii TaxID=192524 RepID=K5X1C9_AGABU|nr:uncharacterized protein AGABI1DRAFT_111871 [Agaricus bisporus var. burnettii JB137-S8]EKM81586.1 hypothetical protein AGABI1DRAFT_111871 [Agaricus bisporus var. burnettii JB137-S8]
MILSAFSLIAVLASSFLARADVKPSEPSPGAVYNEGQMCPISWNADPDGSDDWKSMSIELMTGDNFNMVQLMTLGTTFDGSIDGQHSFTCPDVTLNSAIYFYQFTSLQTTDKAWTTRFTIAGPNGESTPPANAVQPISGEKIAWGVGGLEGSSQSVSPSGPASAGVPPSAESSATPDSQPPAPPAVATAFTTMTPSPTLATTRLAVVTSSTALSSTSAAPNNDTQTDGAVRTSTASVMIALIFPALLFVLF